MDDIKKRFLGAPQLLTRTIAVPLEPEMLPRFARYALAVRVLAMILGSTCSFYVVHNIHRIPADAAVMGVLSRHLLFLRGTGGNGCQTTRRPPLLTPIRQITISGPSSPQAPHVGQWLSHHFDFIVSNFNAYWLMSACAYPLAFGIVVSCLCGICSLPSIEPCYLLQTSIVRLPLHAEGCFTNPKGLPYQRQYPCTVSKPEQLTVLFQVGSSDR